MSIFVLWPLTIIIFITFAFGVFNLMTQDRRTMLKTCYWLFGFSVLAGFGLYSYSFLSYGTALANMPLALLRATFSTARMFFINADYEFFVSAPGAQHLTDNILPQILFWLCHVSALTVTQVVLISLFGRRLMDYFRLRFGDHREVYIIKGSGKNAILLGESIAAHDDTQCRPNAKRLVVFLPGEDDDIKKIYEKTDRFDCVAQAMDSNGALLSCLKTAGLGELSSNAKKYNVIFMPNDASAPDEVRHIAEYAKEKNVNPENLEIFVFASSEWDREEIEAITQVKDGWKRKYPYIFHIICEEDLFTRQMIEKHPPFECPGLDFNEGMAARDFTVMILGFGKMGQHALLRLVMNGQFVGSRMRAIIADKNIDNLRDCFLRRYPELNLCCEMEFVNFDVQCEKFFHLLNEIINVDYVVIALNGDEINKRAALDIRMYYERKDKHGLPFIAVSEKKGGAGLVDEGIFCFGRQEDLYKESVIIREEADRMAKAVHEVYGGNPPWHELDWFTQQSNRAVADFIPAMLKLAGVNKDTIPEGALTEDSALTEKLAQTEKLRWNAFHTGMGYRPMSLEKMLQRFEEYSGTLNSREHLDFCRKDPIAKLHVRLAPWDELDKTSEAYRELAYHADNEKEQTRDFKENDRKVVENIPWFLQKAKSMRNN